MFRHPPQTLPQYEVRLVQIDVRPVLSTDRVRCRLSHARLPVDYIALSYQWGSTAESDMEQIELDGKPFHVTKNLHGFLLAARAHRKGRISKLWIDAISIDQNNVKERNEQVKRMSQIYSNAKEVWIWLGDISPSVSVSVSHMFRVPPGSEGSSILARFARKQIQRWAEESNHSWLQSLHGFCHMGYWDRIWIVQEFLNARHLLFWMGDTIIAAEHIVAFLMEAASSDSEYPPPDYQNLFRSSRAWRLCFAWSARLRDPGSCVLASPIEVVLSTYSMRECADWHDKVYGLLSLVKDGHRFPVDYSKDKVSLIMDVLHFSDHEKLPIMLTCAKFLTALLGVSDRHWLDYEAATQCAVNSRGVSTPKWRRTHMRRRGVVENRLDTDGSRWDFRTDIHYPGGTSCESISRCNCPRCVLTPPLLPGDEIYELPLSCNHPPTNGNLHLAFRTDPLHESPCEWVGTLSTWGYSTRHLLHSLPKLASECDVRPHVEPDPEDPKRLLLVLNPSTILFLICYILCASPTGETLAHGYGPEFSWDHESISQPGPSEMRNRDGIVSRTDLELLAHDSGNVAEYFLGPLWNHLYFSQRAGRARKYVIDHNSRGSGILWV